VKRFSYGRGCTFDDKRSNLEALAIERAQESIESGAWREDGMRNEGAESEAHTKPERKPTNRTPTRWRKVTP
jgi:hypothetical protein